MNPEERKELDAEGLLFQEPDAALLLASGLGRQWPQGRGVFATKSKQVAAWVNEENHLRLTLAEPGDGLHKVFGKFCNLQEHLRKLLQQSGHDFAWSEKL